MKVSKNRYLQLFAAVTVVLALVRCAFPKVADDVSSIEPDGVSDVDSLFSVDTISTSDIVFGTILKGQPMLSQRRCVDSLYVHRIYSVAHFQKTFPDSQQVHLLSAHRNGIKPINSRREAESHKAELVYIGSNPYFYVEPLTQSIPYLVPSASMLLNDIGRNFYDSLYVKGIPLHKIIVSSVLRTKDDVHKLRHQNHNATENSCHMYGTTFDISQNRYQTVEYPGTHCRKVGNDTLKWVLAEVLRDLKEEGRCYVKYEIKQGCFHITVR